jgi:formylglycine-generating enzyme required for sulfatase activity
MDNRLKIIIGAVLLAGVYWAYQWFGTATIQVTSEPTGAIVRVDGRQRGITPITRLELDTGSHRLEVQHSHFAIYVEGMTLRRGDHLQREITLEAGEGTFEFLSNPRNAWVEVDGERLPEHTPTEFTTLSGEHIIAMGQEERHIVEETHTLKAGENLEVNFNLNIDPHGSVTMTTSPRSAKVEFLNQDLVYKPKLRMKIGEYAVRVSKTGYVSEEFRYTVRYGDNMHHVDLDRDYGTLRVVTNPGDADVQVTYADGGRTLHKYYTREMRVPVGNVEVRVRSLGFRTGFKSFNLGNKGATTRFTLEPMNVEPGRVMTDTLASGGAGPELVIIPAGEFQMGDAQGPPSERPVRTVTLTQPFAVTRYEITIGDYLRYAKADGKPLSDRLDPNDVKHALSYVEFRDAVGYADWLSRQTGEKYRLLSEAEWEYVARAGSQTPYFFGQDPEALCNYANVADRTARKRYREWDTLACEDNLVRPGTVGTYQANPFGLHDIYGNVAEWVLDCGMPDYADAPTDGSAADEGLGCETHGVRGGSWDSQAIEAKSSYRNTARSRNDDRGIRLLRVL